MKVYLVRHAESLANKNKIARQEDETPLSEDGRKQATALARRLSKIKVDYILASPNLRAKETAEEINSIVQAPIEYSDLFIERRWASEEIGRPKEDPLAKEIYKMTHENFHNPDWHYSDEENFEDLKARGLKALEKILSLSSLGHENVVVATHGMFMKMLLSCMIMDKDLTSREYMRINGTFRTKNTGITVCDHAPVVLGERIHPWRVTAWNDHTHLG